MSQLKSTSFRWKNIEEFNNNFDLQEYVRMHFPVGQINGNGYISIPCPFHDEETASCVIYTKSYYCFGAGCGAHGDSLDFVSNVTKLSPSEVLKNESLHNIILSEKKKNITPAPKTNYPNPKIISAYNKILMLNNKKMEYLFNRHFNKMAISKANIGYNKHIIEFKNFSAPRYSIPVYDENNKLISARYRIDPTYEKSDEPKYLAHPQAPLYLYNSNLLQHCENIVVVGSEIDAAFLLHRYGIHAVAPPGEGNFKQEWAERFYGKKVLIWYDKDMAGITAAIKTYHFIKHISEAYIYEWPEDFKNKDDICDFVTSRGILEVFEVLNSYNVKAYN